MAVVGAAILGIGKAIGGAIAGSTIVKGLLQVALSIGLSRLAQRLARRRQEPVGTIISATTTTDDTSESFIVGRYATAGHIVYDNSDGSSGGTPNLHYTRVLEISGLPGCKLRGVILKGEFVELDGVSISTPDEGGRIWGDLPDPQPGSRGIPATNDSLVYKGKNHFWCRYNDGTQTATDPTLLARFGSDPDWPWSADMVGPGICYAIVTYRFAPEVWQGGIDPVFVVDGIPLYDPRKDDTVGGDGPHRWDDPDTWGWTDNPIVIAYNIARGITLPDGSVYGGRYGFADVPLAQAVAAMNACDESIDGGRSRRFRFGAEIRVAENEPREVILACVEAAGGRVADAGGRLIFQVGELASPVWTISDDDLSASDMARYAPFKPLDQRVNAVTATHVSPAKFWQPRDLGVLTNAGWEAEDGRRLTADLRLAGVFDSAQADDLRRLLVADGRRERVLEWTLPPEAAKLRLFDTVSVTSEVPGFEDKLFEVTETAQRPDDLWVTVTLREVDPDDFDPPATELPSPVVPAPPATIVRTVPGFNVSPVTIIDSESAPRRVGIRIEWDADAAEDVTGIRFQVRVGFGWHRPVVATGTRDIEDAEAIVSEGLVRATNYEVRAQLIADRRTDWTAWLPVTTGSPGLTDADFENGVINLFLDQGLGPIPSGPIFPVSPSNEDLFFLTTDGQLYQYNATATRWELVVQDGSFVAADKIVANSITGGLLAASGIITDSAQINDALITNAKIATLQVARAKIANNAASETFAVNINNTSASGSTGTVKAYFPFMVTNDGFSSQPFLRATAVISPIGSATSSTGINIQLGFTTPALYLDNELLPGWSGDAFIGGSALMAIDIKTLIASATNVGAGVYYLAVYMSYENFGWNSASQRGFQSVCAFEVIYK